MTKKTYTPQYKAQLVLKVLQEEKQLNEIAAEHEISPNLLRNWKKEFINHASRVFDESKREKEADRKEEALGEEKAQMLKTIGQLTMERDFLQRCYEKLGGSAGAPKARF